MRSAKGLPRHDKEQGIVERLDISEEFASLHRTARGAVPWTSGTSSSLSRAGTLLRRPVAGFYAAVDTWRELTKRLRPLRRVRTI